MIIAADAAYIAVAMIAVAIALVTWLLLTHEPVEDEPPNLDTRGPDDR